MAKDRKTPEPASGDDKLKRERAGKYVTADGRFSVEQASTGWLLLDAEQANELGLPLARGPFATLDEARAAITAARSGPAPVIELPVARHTPAPAGTAKPASTPRAPRKAPARAAPLELVVREIRVTDGDALRALWTGAGLQSLGDDDRGLARLARRNPGLALVATEGTRIVGSALGGWDGRRGWLYHVAVAPSHRRRGIGTRLVRQIESGLRDLGCPKVNALVRDDGGEARRFWTALGYDLAPARQYGRKLD